MLFLGVSIPFSGVSLLCSAGSCLLDTVCFGDTKGGDMDLWNCALVFTYLSLHSTPPVINMFLYQGKKKKGGGVGFRL